MPNILLVEPDYKNKYPPIGLMKIASFHRQRGDFVEFYKGEAPYPLINKADRVYITTLFTFHYDITINCIRHYVRYANKDNIYVGGIASSLLTSSFERDTGIRNIILGQLTDSEKIGYNDHVNIDKLPLDYDILDDISYVYPAGDNYFVHTTRGCPRRCDFCAVKLLEPKFETTNNIIEQVERVDAIYGKKRNLLIMDNNILHSNKLDRIVDDIIALGFDGEKNYVHPNPISILTGKIRRRKGFGANYSKQLDELIAYIAKFSDRISRYKTVGEEFCDIFEKINTANAWEEIQKNEEYLVNITEKYRSKTRMVRYVDFNQGIDARLLNKSKARTLSRIPISPFRLAYDSVDETDTFVSAMNNAIANGISDFSNYILYNWEDRPEDLWSRLHTAIQLYNKSGVKAFSFPMKYAPIDAKDRSFIGEHWNKKYLGAVNIVLNVTKGIVARELDFFYEAFGKNLDEYFKILIMPDEVIRFRHYFRDNGLLELWHNLYDALSFQERELLLDLLCKAKIDRDVLMSSYSAKIDKILILYKMNKSQFDRREKSAEKIIKEIERCESKPNHHAHPLFGSQRVL